MRLSFALTVAVILGGVTAPGREQPPPASARQRLEQARAAMGDPTVIQALSFTVTDRKRNAAFGQSPATREWETMRTDVRMLLPDHFVSSRAEQALGQDSFVLPAHRGGYAGRAVFGYPDIRQVQRSVGYNYALPLFLGTDTVFPFVLRGLQGDILRFEDPEGQQVLLELDRQSNRPRRLRHDNFRQGEWHDTVVGISDYRRVAGSRLALPHKLTFASRPRSAPEASHALYAERLFSGIMINPSLTPADFKR
jgi:hypothetical protein